MSSILRMTVHGSALNLFDKDFIIDHGNWSNVHMLFTNGHDSKTKQEEVSEELSSVRITNLRSEDESEEESRTKNDLISTLAMLALLSDSNR